MTMDTAVPAKVSGFAAGIAASLDFGRARLMGLLKGLTPEQLAYVPPGFQNSIATLVVHIAAAEIGISNRLLGKSVADDLKAEFLLDQPQNPLPAAANETVESLVAKTEKGRAILNDALAQLSNADLDRTIERPSGSVTLRWYLSLLPNHQAQHLGHIQYIKKMFPAS